MSEDGAPGLVTKTAFSIPVSGGQLAPNPVIELTATVGDGNTLLIWRADNQPVTKYTERNLKIHAIRWKEDGQFLAVGWSDGVVRLVGLENGKAVHHIHVSDKSKAGIEYIAWSRNLTGRQTARISPKRPWETLLSDELNSEDKLDLLDLPHELTFLEVDTALPKISPLPLSGGTGDDMHVFSVRASLDFVFRAFRAEDTESVDVMLVGTSDGGIHLSIYDSFAVGTFNYVLPSSLSGSGPLHLYGHGSHPETSTHALLFKPDQEGGTSLYLVPLDLTFIHSSPVNLSLLASKTTTLQNLLRYIKQTQTHMVGEWKSTRDLPNRFLAGVQEDLEKSPSGPMTIVQALYHTVATGHVFPQVQEWLVDSLAERGHKRWDKAVTSGLENLRALVHENLMPALERCGIILSRLLGIARFHENRDVIGFNPAQISRLLDIISCLSLLAHKILIQVMEELDLFSAFSTWLRFEIDKLVSSSAAEELSEKEATMDNTKVLEYIRGVLTSSPLSLYFDEVDKEDYSRDWDHVEDGPSLLEMLDKQLQKRESGQPYMKALPNLVFLVNYLTSRANLVFREIAEAERRNVRFGQPTELPVGNAIWKTEVRMQAANEKDGIRATIVTAVASTTEKNKITIFRSNTHITNGMSGDVETAACALLLKEQVIDYKFSDDDTLAILFYSEEHSAPCIVTLAHQAPFLPYSELSSDKPIEIYKLEPRDLSLVTMEKTAEFRPIQMEIQGGKIVREGAAARASLLGRDRVAHRVYALPQN
ncbi:hypothetical protein GQ53DRAFT_690575 [Thozetella sp. PMI_491]|nr:hypothetical protein GQ53DRAFT_690575 [Thozetella sp. PMI_491]